LYQINRKRKNGDVWTTYIYRGSDGIDISLGKDLNQARLKWAELEAKAIPADLTTMKGIFDRYALHIIPKKSERTQSDNIKELKQLRPLFDEIPINAINPAMIAAYRDKRTAKTRANREIALLSHVFNIAREWGLTNRENPCRGVRKNKEKPRDFYANDKVWAAVYGTAVPELKNAMDLAYLTGQRPADVRLMGRDDVVSGYLFVHQGKTDKRLRIQLDTNGIRNALGRLIDRLMADSTATRSPYFITNKHGRKISGRVLANRWDDARSKAIATAVAAGDHKFAGELSKFQFRDIRPKAASEIIDLGDASLLLGHSKQEITKKVYRRVGAIASPTK
jgi:integrase